MPDKKNLLKTGEKAIHYLILAVVSSMIIYLVLSVQAGSLNPTLPVASTMKHLDEIYSVIFGSYDSSGVSSKSDGNVSETLKCITDKMNSRTCD